MLPAAAIDAVVESFAHNGDGLVEWQVRETLCYNLIYFILDTCDNMQHFKSFFSNADILPEHMELCIQSAVVSKLAESDEFENDTTVRAARDELLLLVSRAKQTAGPKRRLSLARPRSFVRRIGTSARDLLTPRARSPSPSEEEVTT